MRTISPTVARRLAITAQRLAGARPTPNQAGILTLVRQLGCLQLDPISVVAPSHRLVLWSRLGNYPIRALETLQWETRQLFEYWAHAASIVLTEDYPIHRRLMLAWQRGDGWSRRYHPWVEDNAALKRHLLREIRRRGPLPTGAFEDRAQRPWQSSGWTAERNVDRMLAYLWITGTLVIASRESGKRWWDLADRWLPDWTPKQRVGEREVVRRAAQRSLRALGVARPRDIERHFISGRYPGLRDTLDSLERAGTIIKVRVKARSVEWPGTWYVHAEDLPTIDKLEVGEWQPRTTLLSPFDNLIRDRERTKLMFGFDYTLEIYTPAVKRRFGYYVLPILQGDQLIGRLDAAVDRKRRDLALRAVHAEPGRIGRESGGEIAKAIHDLALFVGADTITQIGSTPPGWRAAFRKAF